MVRHDRPAARRPRLLTSLVALTIGAATFGLPSPASADVTEVGGGAFGYSASVSLFEGPVQNRGPAPAVTLPASGSASPVAATEPGASAQFGPAEILDTGPLRVSTQGTTGPDGSVESSASVTGLPDGPGPVLYGELTSRCTAREGEVSGSTTVANGRVETSYNRETQEAATTQPVPQNPPPNTEISGTIDHVGDSFRAVYNEQIRSGNGITVNAVHLYMLGPIAKGDLIIGQSRCSVSAAAGRAPTAGQAPATTGAPARAGGATTTTAPPSGGAQGGSGATSGGSGMATTGSDVLPMAIMASAFVIAGAIVLVEDPRRLAMAARQRGRRYAAAGRNALRRRA